MKVDDTVQGFQEGLRFRQRRRMIMNPLAVVTLMWGHESIGCMLRLGEARCCLLSPPF